MQKYGGTLIFSEADSCGLVEVVDYTNLRTLHFGNVVEQSSMFLDQPYRLRTEYNRVMMMALLFNPFPFQALFLGLGGGSKQKFLWNYFPNCHIQTVEWSPIVIKACQQFFAIPSDVRLQIICQEAHHFIRSFNPLKYDFIFIDLYTTEGISAVFDQPDFFVKCRDLLESNGILIWNIWSNASPTVFALFFKAVAEFFGNRYLILPNEESPNHVILVFPASFNSSILAHLSDHARILTSQTNLDFTAMLTKYQSLIDCLQD